MFARWELNIPPWIQDFVYFFLHSVHAISGVQQMALHFSRGHLVISKCANPECSVPLRYLRDGRLYQFEVKATRVLSPDQSGISSGIKRPSRQIWHFWLCGQCASTMTLAFDHLEGLRMVPKIHEHVSFTQASA